MSLLAPSRLISEFAEHSFNGYAVRDWMRLHADYSLYIATLYLAFVFKGPDLVDWLFQGKPPVKLLKKMWMVWNFLLSAFSIYGTLYISPFLARSFMRHGMRETLCTFRPEEFYTSPIGLAMGAFCLSKLPEFGDTFFLIMQGKRKLPFLQWFHHVTIFLCCWFAYQEGSSIMIIVASMNYAVHAIMYFYFAMAEAGYKDLVKPFAMYITIMQIAQMVGGLYMTTSYMLYQRADPQHCNGTSPALARTQLMIYICNFYLFSEMFIKNYVLPPKVCNGKKTN